MPVRAWLPRIAAAAVPCYFIAVYLLDRSAAAGPVVDAILMPGVLAMSFGAPLIEPLGLTTGGWFDSPTDAGCLVLIAVYSILVWGVVRLLSCWR